MVVGFLMTLAPVNTAFAALTESQLNFYAQNNILFYDPGGCFSGSAFGGGMAHLDGDTVPAKVVNYLNGNNPSGFTLPANAIAGILANFQGESAFNPFRFEGDAYTLTKGYGIAQFTPATKITERLQSDSRTSGYFNQYFDVSYSSTNGETGYPNKTVPEEVLNSWLLVQLDYFFGPSSESENTRIGSYRHMGGEMGLPYISDSMNVHQAMAAAQSPEDAARIFVWIMERPADKEGAVNRRASMAREWYGKITSGGESYSGSGGNTSQSSGSVMIIGDSITEGSKSQIAAKIPGAKIDSKVGRHFSEGLSILKQAASSGSLSDVVIFALGTNDAGGVTSSMAEEVVNIVGKDRKVIFVTNHTLKADYTSNNNVFSKMASSYSNVSLADWKGAILSKESQYLAADGIHPNEAGRELFASLLANGGSFAAASGSYPVCNTADGMIGENMSEDLAEAVVRFYNSSESDPYMRGLLGKNSCVTFVHVFLRKFTTLGASVTYPGNGRDTARALAAATGLPTSSTPVAISVFSYDSNYVMCGNVGCGHTGIVAAVNGDDIIVMEAGYKGGVGGVRHVKASEFPSGTLFVNINSVIDRDALNSVVGR